MSAAGLAAAGPRPRSRSVRSGPSVRSRAVSRANPTASGGTGTTWWATSASVGELAHTGPLRRAMAGRLGGHPVAANVPPRSGVLVSSQRGRQGLRTLPRCYQNARYQAYPGRHSLMPRCLLRL